MPISQRSTRAIPTRNWKLVWKMLSQTLRSPKPSMASFKWFKWPGKIGQHFYHLAFDKPSKRKNIWESAALSTDETGAFHPSMNSAFGKLGPTWRVSDGLHGKKSQNIPRNSSAVTTIIDSISTVVGGWPTPLKNISQLGWLFPLYGKIKNDPKHQPVVGWVSDLSPVFGQIHHWWNPYCWWEIPDSS